MIQFSEFLYRRSFLKSINFWARNLSRLPPPIDKTSSFSKISTPILTLSNLQNENKRYCGAIYFNCDSHQNTPVTSSSALVPKKRHDSSTIWKLTYMFMILFLYIIGYTFYWTYNYHK